MDGGIDAGGSGLDARRQHGHVEKRGADVDGDLCAGPTDQSCGRSNIHCVERVRSDNAGGLKRIPLAQRFYDALAFFDGARGEMELADCLIFLCALVNDHLTDAAGADDEHVLCHFRSVLLFRLSLQDRLD